MSDPNISDLFPALSLEVSTSGKPKNEEQDVSMKPPKRTSGKWRKKKKMQKVKDTTHASPIPLEKKRKHEVNHSGKLKKKKKKKLQEHEWSKFCGIKKSGDMFMATIKHPASLDGRLGTFKSPETAALAYDIAAYNLHGSQSVLNFPGVIRIVKLARAKELEMTLADASVMLKSMTLVDGSGKLKEGEQEGWAQRPVETFMLDNFRGIKVSGNKFMAMLEFPPCLQAIYKCMLCMGRYGSQETAALAHDIAAYNLYGPHAVFNFPEVIRFGMGLPSSDDGQNKAFK